MNLALIGKVVLENKMFENNVHLHVYSPVAGTDNPLGSLFHKHKYSVKLVICCKFKGFYHI